MAILAPLTLVASWSASRSRGWPRSLLAGPWLAGRSRTSAWTRVLLLQVHVDAGGARTGLGAQGLAWSVSVKL